MITWVADQQASNKRVLNHTCRHGAKQHSNHHMNQTCLLCCVLPILSNGGAAAEQWLQHQDFDKTVARVKTCQLLL
jgi:hypothetical protein